jgi:D-alanine-D-alanine ligase
MENQGEPMIIEAEKQRTDIPVLLIYNVDPHWIDVETDKAHLLANQMASGLIELGHPVQLIAICDNNLADNLASFNPAEHIVFNWCEEIPGIPHSEPLAAGILEICGFTYTGADPRALDYALNKSRIKAQLEEMNIPTPVWRVYDSAGWNGWDRFPAIIKPACEHCSLGIDTESVVTTEIQLYERIAYILRAFQQPALVEEFISGREVTATIIGNEDLCLLPVAEVDFDAIENKLEHIRTFDSKFEEGSSAYRQIKTIIPADLSETEYNKLTSIACMAYRATDCRDYARLDLRLENGHFYILDINHNADLSPDASLPLSAQAAGISYAQLVSCIVNLAAKRHPGFTSGA